MKQLVIIPGGFHPFHAGHAALYQSAQAAFPGADVYVAATNDTSQRPFPFAIKEKLAKLAGVEAGHFVQVKSPFRAEEIVHQFDPNDTQLIFVRSEKDANKPPQGGGTKKDGSPSYLQPLGDDALPLSQHAYMTYLPTVEFGPGMTSATEIRGVWPNLNEKRKTALVMSLYPATQKNPKLAANVIKMLDTAMGAVDESALGDLPRPNKRNQFKSLHRLRKQRGLDEQGMAEGEQPGKSVTDAIQKVMPMAQEIWFHGSRATGSHRRNSDTDILVVVPDDLVGDQYLAVVRILQKLSSIFDNYDIQPTKSGTNIHRIAQEEGQLLWSNKQGVAEEASPMIKPPANRFDNKQEAFDYAKEHGGKVFKSTYIDPNTGIKNITFVVKKEQGMAEGPTADQRAFFAGADSNRQPKWRPDPKTAKLNDIQLIIQKYKKLGADAITQDEYEKLKLYRLGKQLYEKAAVPVVANPDYMEENIKRG